MQFGRLTLLCDLPASRMSLYHCACGTEAEVNRYNVRAGRQVSCGCQRRESASARAKRRVVHGQKGTKEYEAWRSMRSRCTDPGNPSYHRYGGRKITVHPAWDVAGGDGFLSFLAEVGPAPSKAMSLDRINNDGNYEPGNVHWATAREQTNNRAVTVFVVAFGEVRPLTVAAEAAGLGRVTLAQRLKRGWDHELAITTQPDPQRYRRTKT
jgi:hypothetical protein